MVQFIELFLVSEERSFAQNHMFLYFFFILLNQLDLSCIVHNIKVLKLFFIHFSIISFLLLISIYFNNFKVFLLSFVSNNKILANLYFLAVQLCSQISLKQGITVFFQRYARRKENRQTLSDFEVSKIDDALAFLLLSLTILFGHYT